MILNNKTYDETDAGELLRVAIDIVDDMIEAYGTVHWTQSLDDSARNFRRVAHAMDLLREKTTYVDHSKP